ncbi:response regulator [Paenibacillus sp. M1]|uniref:Response regulator n=1 Tax=Paenibacillus haidiansis TaxID=1574488 RepID=A0ABU7VMM3_9BACL
MNQHRLLIIDDEPWSREVVKALGQWENHRIEIAGEAEDGILGLKMIQELEPDIVLTDMRMPGMEGAALLKEMSAKFPNIQIIVMSGYDDFVYLKQAIRSRAVEYLLKPVNPDELNEALARSVKAVETLQKTATPPNIPLVFTDKEILDEYLAYRQRIFGYLLTLDKKALQMEFKSLGIFLTGKFPDGAGRSMAGQVGHDFLLILGKFSAEHDLVLEEISDLYDPAIGEEANEAPWQSFTEATAELGTIFEAAMNLCEMNKNKGRLDLDEVNDYIAKHFADDISLESVARYFYVSKTYLSRMFKQHTGENVSDTILRHRMNKARELIVEQGLPIKYAAQLAGYEDLTYFYRVFKKFYGIPPGEMRRDE